MTRLVLSLRNAKFRSFYLPSITIALTRAPDVLKIRWHAIILNGWHKEFHCKGFSDSLLFCLYRNGQETEAWKVENVVDIAVLYYYGIRYYYWSLGGILIPYQKNHI